MQSIGSIDFSIALAKIVGKISYISFRFHCILIPIIPRKKRQPFLRGGDNRTTPLFADTPIVRLFLVRVVVSIMGSMEDGRYYFTADFP